MSKPSSFCTMCTHQHVSELFGLLLSISIYHPGSPIIIISDSKTKYIVEQSTPQPNLQLKWIIVLNKYCHLDRDTMERAGILHDWLYAKVERHENISRRKCDRIFLLFMKLYGVGIIKRRIIYWAVRAAGRLAFRKKTPKFATHNHHD